MKYRLPKRSAKRDFLFNMFGSTANAAVSVLLLIIVSRVSGEEKAGVFTLCYSTAQMMYMLGSFELRSVQVTDAKKEFSFGNALAFRLMTILFMFLFALVFMFVRGFSGEKIVIALLLTLYMGALALSDVFQGNQHYHGYLFLGSLGLGCEVLCAAGVFFAVLCLTDNLIVAVVPMSAVVLLWLVFLDIPFSRALTSVRPAFEKEKIKKLFFATAPLALALFLNQFIFNAPKFAIDTVLTEADQSHYGYLIMPAFAINLLSLFVFRPRLVSLSKQWISNRAAFFRQVRFLYGWVALATLVTVGIGFLFGIPVLNLLYNAKLEPYRVLLALLLIGGGFSAGCSLTITLLTVIRKQKFGLIAYGVVACAALFAPELLVQRFRFEGAAYAYLMQTALLFAILITIFILCARRPARREPVKTEE